VHLMRLCLFFLAFLAFDGSFAAVSESSKLGEQAFVHTKYQWGGGGVSVFLQVMYVITLFVIAVPLFVSFYGCYKRPTRLCSAIPLLGSAATFFALMGAKNGWATDRNFFLPVGMILFAAAIAGPFLIHCISREIANVLKKRDTEDTDGLALKSRRQTGQAGSSRNTPSNRALEEEEESRSSEELEKEFADVVVNAQPKNVDRKHHQHRQHHHHHHQPHHQGKRYTIGGGDNSRLQSVGRRAPANPSNRYRTEAVSNRTTTPSNGPINRASTRTTNGGASTRPSNREKSKAFEFIRNHQCVPFGIVAPIVVIITVAVIMSDFCRLNAGYMGSRCSAFCECKSGLTCHPFANRCYPSQRANNQPCMDSQYPCASGSCLAFFQECSDGSCGSPCVGDSDCNSGLQCSQILSGGICVSRDSDEGSGPTERLALCLKTWVPPNANYSSAASYNLTRYNTFEEFPECRATVVDQGCCGSCVAFAVATEVAIGQCMRDSIRGYNNTSSEWRVAVARSIIVDRGNTNVFTTRGIRYTHLSEQHLLSCSMAVYPLKQSNWQTTCDGFFPDSEHQIVSAFGIQPYYNQTYEEGDRYFMSDVCTDSGSKVASQCSKVNSVQVFKGCKSVIFTHSEPDKARLHIARYGAIVATILSEELFMQSDVTNTYHNQIIYKEVTGSDHAVTLVGWGSEGDQKYFFVQNSWGNTFGNEGVVRLDERSINTYYGCVPSETFNP